jgi:hypothetical protein
MADPLETALLQELLRRHRDEVALREADDRHRAQQQREREELVFLPEENGLVELQGLAGYAELRHRDRRLAAAFLRFVEAVLKRAHDAFAGVGDDLAQDLPNQSMYWVDIMRSGVWEPERREERDLLTAAMHELARKVADDSLHKALAAAERILTKAPGKDPLPENDDDDCCKSLRAVMDRIADILEKDAASGKPRTSSRPQSS